MNWLHYLIEANVYLAVFYAGYCAFLNKETYYTLNRVYLLVSCLVSFLLPVIQIGTLKPMEPEVKTLTFVIRATGAKPVIAQLQASHITMQDILVYAYLLGVIVLTILLLFKLFRLLKMTRIGDKLVNDKYKMVNIEDSNVAFSFFNYLFIGSKTLGSDIIIRHELVHIRQKHSADIVFLEIMKIMNWFNPFIYLVQISLKTVHEYIADEQTAAYETDALTYSSFLVNNAYGLSGPSVTHSFFNYNLLKKRIIMLNQKRSGNLARLKYLVAVPICAALLCASTLGFSKTYGWVDLAPQKIKALTAMDTGGESQHLKVPKYMLQPPPPPTLVKDAYVNLFNYLNKTINYPETALKNEKAGLVIVSVNVKNDHKLYDIKIIKKASDEFNNEVVKALSAYNGLVTDKPGEHKVAINFCTDYQKFTKSADAALLQKPGYDLAMIFYNAGKYPVMPPPHAPASINKNAINLPPPPLPTKAKPAKPAAPNAADTQELKAPEAPVAPVDIAVSPPAPPKGPFDSLYKYIAKYVRYPASARENLIAGRIILSLNIVNGKIEGVKLRRGVSDDLDAEAIRVIKSFKGTLNVKSANCTMPVFFALLDQHDKYVGESPNDGNKNKVKFPAPNPKLSQNVYYSLDQVVIVGYVTTKS
ncbi:M56 family metallopeptidase [Mucilaginibacter sp. SP1R1]|uniref:M56 family metallopeptidase n=1 Tax=Mucilaginibacter sp. SP1R1 TaxID=2723091 RepID=UPI00161865A3|nr:M56 family metallopeptidase [Mucilaginibacter sp. SP1R1]MBB6150545.1 outer membrane biosynthesis protein TonB [Mucilaginibacter sp. SP1R1]